MNEKYVPKLVAVADRAGNVLTQPGIRKATPIQRAYIRAAGAAQNQVEPAAFLRDDRARRDRDCFLLRAAAEPAPTIADDLQAAKRRPWDAPMATRDHAVDPATILLARVLAWCGGLALIGVAVVLATWLGEIR